MRGLAPLHVDELGHSDTWAFVALGEVYSRGSQPGSLCLLGWTTHPVLYDTALDHCLLTDRIGSEMAEREALTWAALWRLRLNVNTPTIFRSDSLVNAHQARGDTGSSEDTLTFRIMRGCFQALEQCLPGDALSVEHVYGHCGEPWNELADKLAGDEAVRSFHRPRMTLDFAKYASAIPSLWLLFCQHRGLPCFTGSGFDAAPCQLPEPGTVMNATLTRNWQTFQISCSFMSANVNSLSCLPTGHSGKLDYLRQQFIHSRCNIAGLQESRAPAGLSCVDNVLRVASGAVKGQGGVELWINLQQPVAYTETRQKQICIARKQVSVSFADPSVLIVTVVTGLWDCTITVAHAPHCGKAESSRAQWWDNLQHLIQQYHAPSRELFLLIDANSKSGPADFLSVFQHADDSDVNTPFFRELLEHFALCLPSTGDCHTGAHHTWVGPSGTLANRIDYIAVPRACLQRCTHSQVLEHFDLATTQFDHFPVGLQLDWNTWKSATTSEAPKASIDRSAIGSCDLRAALDRLHCMHPKDWQHDIETEVTTLNQSILSAISQPRRKQQSVPKKHFIGHEIWTLRDQKLRARKALKDIKRQALREGLTRMLRAWKLAVLMERRPHSTAIPGLICTLDLSWNYGCSLRTANVRQVSLFTSKHLTLRKALACAKQKSLQKELEQMPPSASSADILRTLKSFQGTTNLSKKKVTPIPLVHNNQGSPCTSPAEAMDTWIDFFSQMEGGTRMTGQELHSQWRQHLARVMQSSDFSIDLDSMPTLVDVETALRRVKKKRPQGQTKCPPKSVQPMHLRWRSKSTP